jgi:hypothetical protein
VAYLLSIITFIQWFRRAYYNLHQKVAALSHAEGWAAGSWFVPIINFYRPCRIMTELYRKSREVLKQGGVVNINPGTSAVDWWWPLWILSVIIERFVSRFSMKAETVDELIAGTVGEMVLNMIAVALVVITVKVIKDYARVEPLLHGVEEEEV